MNSEKKRFIHCCIRRKFLGLSLARFNEKVFMERIIKKVSGWAILWFTLYKVMKRFNRYGLLLNTGLIALRLLTDVIVQGEMSRVQLSYHH